VREREALLGRVRDLRASLLKDARRVLQQARHRLAVIQGSYVFRKSDELVRQRRQTCDDLRMRLEDGMAACFRERRTRVERAARSLALLSPARQLQRAGERLNTLRRRLFQSGITATERWRARTETLRARLDALSPLAILERGYTLVFKRETGELVRDAAQLEPGDSVAMRLGKGGADATITEIHP